MKELRLESSEWMVVVLGSFLFAIAFYLYATNFPLQEYLFKINFNIQQPQVGVLQFQDGLIKRKSAEQNEFKSIKASSELYNLDTLVTDSQSKATVLLEDGSTIELSPSTMIQLVFEKSLAIDGISRSATIKIVTGNVSGSSKKDKLILKSKKEIVQLTADVPKKELTVEAPVITPLANPQVAMVTPVPSPVVTPEPIPVETAAPPPPIEIPKITSTLNVLSPKNGATISIADFSPRAVAKVPIRFTIKPAQTQVMVKVTRGDSEVIFDGPTERGTTDRTVNVELDKPGSFKYVIWVPEKDGYKEIKKEGRVRLSDSFKGIQVQDPLIAGANFKTNEYNGKLLKDFDVTFHWVAYPDVNNYSFKFFKSGDTRNPLLEKVTSTPELTLNKNKVFSGNVLYTITATTGSGFKVSSGLTPFRFDFLPPHLVEPKNATVIAAPTPKASGSDDQRILFTWQKTNFTDAYEIEFSQTASFEKKVLTNKLKENFLLLKTPAKGRYFWRVKSHARGAVSPPSPANEFTIK